MVLYDSEANLLLLELPSIPPSYRPYYLGEHPNVWHRERVCSDCTPTRIYPTVDCILVLIPSPYGCHTKCTSFTKLACCARWCR